MASDILAVGRRRILRIVAGVPIILAGCLGDDGSGEDDTGLGMDDDMTGDGGEERRSNGDGESVDSSAAQNTGEDPYSGPRFEVEPFAENEPSADDPLTLRVDVDHRESEPSQLDIAVTNESGEKHTVAFGGFVPWPDLFGQHVERDDQLVLVPGDDTPSSPSGKYVVDEERRAGRYFAPLEPVDSPDAETSVELAPGDSVGGSHDVLDVPESDDERPWSDGPYPGEYYFETTVDVPSANSSATMSFGLFVDYAEV